MVQERCEIPTVLIEADMTDARNFSESQIETRIDAFMELLSAKNPL
jgi:benzoyl-CoA reductase/2-hydroxyglutaryl-CoA dehydratase subunit BcrC/BadD/HgdB